MNMNVNIVDGGIVVKYFIKYLDFIYFEYWNFFIWCVGLIKLDIFGG